MYKLWELRVVCIRPIILPFITDSNPEKEPRCKLLNIIHGLQCFLLVPKCKRNAENHCQLNKRLASLHYHCLHLSLCFTTASKDKPARDSATQELTWEYFVHCLYLKCRDFSQFSLSKPKKRDRLWTLTVKFFGFPVTTETTDDFEGIKASNSEMQTSSKQQMCVYVSQIESRRGNALDWWECWNHRVWRKAAVYLLKILHGRRGCVQLKITQSCRGEDRNIVSKSHVDFLSCSFVATGDTFLIQMMQLRCSNSTLYFRAVGNVSSQLS